MLSILSKLSDIILCGLNLTPVENKPGMTAAQGWFTTETSGDLNEWRKGAQGLWNMAPSLRSLLQQSL